MTIGAETLAKTCGAGSDLLESVRQGRGLVEEITDMEVSFLRLMTYLLHRLKVWLIEQHLIGTTRSVVAVMEHVSEEIEEMCYTDTSEHWSFTEVGSMTMDFAYEVVEYLRESGWPDEPNEVKRLWKVMDMTIDRTFETFGL